MIIWSTAALGDGRATLSRGYSYGKNERLALRNEDVWERNRGKESKTLTGESSHSNEIGSIWNIYFFFLYPNAHLLATSYNRPSEWDRESVRGRQQSHMKREWGYIFHFSAAILSHENHNHLKVWPTILAYCQVLSAPLCFDRTKRYAVL